MILPDDATLLRRLEAPDAEGVLVRSFLTIVQVTIAGAVALERVSLGRWPTCLFGPDSRDECGVTVFAASIDNADMLFKFCRNYVVLSSD